MYWFQDIESARALARLYSKSPHLPCDDGALPLPVAAAQLIDEPAMDDVAPGSREDASVMPCAPR
jgi:hypothetical protein